MPEEILTGLILAGGTSRRMGQDKSQLDISGQTLIHRARTLLNLVGCQRILISSNHLAGAVADRFPDCGPVAGIEAAMKALINSRGRGRMLVIPVDMPFLTSDVLTSLIGESSESDIVRFDNQPLPLLINVSHPVHQRLETALRNTDEGKGIAIKALCQLLKCSKIPATEIDPERFFNCNTPEEYQQVLSRLSMGPE